MRFLVDAQLPKRLSDFLNDRGHNSIHTLQLPQQNSSTNIEIAHIAIADQRVVVSKDLDFLESYLLQSIPQKLILIRTGNIKNDELIHLLEENLEHLLKAISRSNLVEFNRTEIVEHE